jgi:hypothetical protein
VPLDAQQLHADAIARYDDAVDRRRLLIEKWEADGKPMVTSGGSTGKAEVPHPLLKSIGELDALCDRLARVLTKRPHAGRPPGAASAPDRQDGVVGLPSAPPRLRVAE